MSYITTVSGKHFDPIKPDEKLIDIDDIGHALALICRGNGHVSHFYSVAQHSIACAIEAKNRGYKDELALAALLHDASEAYLSDVTRPVKKDLEYYLRVEENLQNIIWKHFLGRILSTEEKKIVQEIDDDMLSMEFHLLFPENINERYINIVTKIDCSDKSIVDVELQFSEIFNQLIKK